MSSKAIEPQSARTSGSRPALWRLLGFGVALALGAGLLRIFGADTLGEPAMILILAALAAVGIFFIFALLLGYIELGPHRAGDRIGAAIADGLKDGLLVTDADNRIHYANRAYEQITGAPNARKLSSLETILSRRPETAEIIYRMRNRLRSNEPCDEEFRLTEGLRPVEKGAGWFRIQAWPFSDNHQGQMTAWLISDVTEDRQRQESAFQELQKAISYLDHAPAGFFASEADGSITYMNATLADWLGIDLTRFSARSLSLADLVLGESMALLDTVRAENAGGKISVIDLDMARSDGTSIPVRLYHSSRGGSDGAPAISRTLVLNRMLVGDSNAADAEIRFTRFFNNTPMAIAAFGADGKISRANAPFQRMFAGLISKAGGQENLCFHDLASSEGREAIAAAFQAALAGKAKIEPVDIAGEGERYIRIFVSAVAPDDGSEDQVRAIVYAMDLTEHKALEAQFTQGQKMQAVGQLAGGIAHDFNNVLTAIIGFSDLLLANHRPADPSFQDIMNIKQNANRAASLVRQLLAFSRRQTLRPQVLHLGDVLSDLRMLLARLLGEKIELDVVHGRDLWPTRADLSQFEQVIVNLAVNARDAMPEGGKLTIRTSNIDAEMLAGKFSIKEIQPGDYVLLEVEDEGIGMSEEILGKIFEPFFSTKEVGKGTGLGLSTVYGIIRQTGGHIDAQSMPGQGTVFRVFLPRFEQSAEAGAMSLAAPSAPETEQRRRDLTGSATVLLVEDEDAVRAFASRALKTRGYRVHEAASGIEALEIMHESGAEVDLVISDVVMPEMDGPTLFTELRKDHPSLKFIFISGYAEDAFARNLPNSEEHNFGFLPKPFTLKQLATTVKEVLEGEK